MEDEDKGIRTILAAMAFAPLLCCARAPAAGTLVEPPVLESRNGVLDIMMVAMPQPIAGISFTPPGGGAPVHPTGWVYQVCPRPPSGLACPPGSSTVSGYGGVRLALEPGDRLKVRFVNRLPAVEPTKLKHAADAGGSNLFLNPTNLHTHGIVTPARTPTTADPTFGDYVYVSIFNSANGIPMAHAGHEHGPIVMDTVDYAIRIPADHPRGLFWFHPHVHGLSLNQVSEGLSGLITLGSVGDYASGDAGGGRWPAANVRHLMLKETQVLANGEILHQQDADFCEQFPARGEVRKGSCPGKNDPDDRRDFTGGKWYMTVNGQQFPTVSITAPDGEIWRVASGAGNLTWDLKLVDDATHEPIAVQLIAVDGAAAHLPQARETPGVVPCANAVAIGSSVPLCVNEIVMMPGSRAEFWVTYRNARGVVAPPPKGSSAMLRMVGLTMGTGDAWPAVDLAKVRFEPRGPRKLTRNQVVVAASKAATPSVKASTYATQEPTPASCVPLPSGHRRRIFFGFSDVARSDTFALGYEEVDEQGKVVAESQKPAPDRLEQFDPSHTTICLPLGPGQAPVRETWEVVQLSTENHNFHIHQTRFRHAGSPSEPLQDNFPLGVAVPDATLEDEVAKKQNGVCTIAQWRSGHCASPTEVFDVPFSQPGEFIYHCHILEHEDGGMMGKIRVVPSRS
jgi:L-ascorbate oxidase